MAQKKPVVTGKIDIKNSLNDNEYCHRVQVFRRELPRLLPKTLSLAEKIEFLGNMIPKIQIKQMREFAESLQTAYLIELEAQGKWQMN